MYVNQLHFERHEQLRKLISFFAHVLGFKERTAGEGVLLGRCGEVEHMVNSGR